MSQSRKPPSSKPKIEEYVTGRETISEGSEGQNETQPFLGTVAGSTAITAIPVSFSLTSPQPPQNPSAPHIATDPVRYLEPDYASFANVVANDFIHAADTQNNFLSWASQNPDTDWIRRPNAVTDDNLLKVVNGDSLNYEANTGRGAIVAAHAFLTLGIGAFRATKNILPGTIQFSNNAGTQMIHVKPGLSYLASPRHNWGTIKKASDNLITDGNITIVRVPQGSIGFAMENGHPIVLLPGRHGFNNPLLTITADNIFVVKERNVVKFSTITIVRVFPNELGLAYEDSKPIILLPGIHIKNSATFQFRNRVNIQSFKKINDEDNELPNQALAPYLEHGNISIARINQGELGSALDGREYVMMRPGLFIRSCQTFKFNGAFNANAAHIQNGTIHLIRVDADKIGLAWDNNRAIFLDAKFHEYNSSLFRFDKFESANAPLIQHGTLTRVRINEGEIGFAWHRGVAIELGTGMHLYDDSQFIFAKTFKSNDETITFGNITRIIVKQGQARPIWVDGVLQVKEAGVWEFKSPKINVGIAIPLQDTVKTYKEIQVTTRDRMPMHVTGQIKYRVTSPEMVLLKIGTSSLDEAIEKMSHSSLREQMSTVTVSMISSDHFRPHKSADVPDVEDEKRVTLYDTGSKEREGGDSLRSGICHAVLERLRQDTDDWGVAILNFAINDIGYQNKQTETNLASATEKTRSAEAGLDLQMAENAREQAKVQGEANRKLVQERNAAAVLKIKFEMEAANNKIQADGNFDKAKREAETTVEAQTIAANARRSQAEAQRDADIAKAEGEKALAAAQILLLDNAGYLQIESLKHAVEIAQHLSSMQTPAVIMGGGDSQGNGQGGMFFGQGMQLLQYALAKNSMFAPTGTGVPVKMPVTTSQVPLLESKTEHGIAGTPTFHK
jgi:regulator of protease activity HflC (stomatin/prohibitin superfamily)